MGLPVLLVSLTLLPPAPSPQGATPPRDGAATPGIDFDRQIRPILSDRCFPCHGPDAKARKGKLRLDTFAGATRDRGGYAALVPGDPAASELLKRVQEPDPKERMPPTRSKLTVSAAEADLLRRWIAEGGGYASHWAFEPPRDKAAPPVQRAEWVRDPIDRFVLARLEQAGRAPAAEASRETWLRRVSFALTGLGPTPEEIDGFLADREEGAHRRVVQRLLASPRFGERMAQDWLDVARYADTYGYQADVDRRVWPYRDWVIRAFNDNLPFDRFLTWQLAGDLLPGATRAQRIATAFNRLHRQTNEGGSVEEEYRVEYVADRTETCGTAFLGLTLGCAQCHDHKFDPIAQADFYRLAAFFDQIDESGLYSHFTRAVPTPALLLSTPEQDRQLADLRRRIGRAERELAGLATERGDGFRDWLAGTKGPPAGGWVRGRVGDYSLDDLKDGLRNRVAPGEAKQRAAALDQPRVVPGRVGGAVQLDGEDNLSFPVGGFRRTDPFTIALWLRVPKRLERAVVFHHSRAWTDSGSQGYQLLLEDGRLSASLIHFWPGNAIRVRSVATLPLDTWVHVVVAYDGSSRAEGLALYQDGERAPVSVVRDGLTRSIVGGGHKLTIGQRFRDKGLVGGSVDEFQVYDRCLTAIEVAELFRPGRFEQALASAAAGPRADLRRYYLSAVDPAAAAARQRLAALRAELAKAIDRIPEIMTMRDRGVPRPTYVLSRGAYDARVRRVAPGTPAAVLEFPDTLPRNRLGLARWLTLPDHPLTARVAVNRLWHIAFGSGLVRTLENFGTQGEPPTHPELLDHLARSFVAAGWDVKAMLTRIVLSATFRQGSAVPRGDDPENRLLGRGPSRRLPAEMLRDHALHAGGLLVEKIGGPSVKPYQPPGLWKEKSGQVYRADKGEGLYRRSLYTFWKRTSPPPSMMIFDAAKRDVCIARRQQTNTPLQALVLLNDPQFVEAARMLADRVIRRHEAPGQRVAAAFRRLTSRSPSGAELAVLTGLLVRQRQRFAAEPAAARGLLGVGDRPAGTTDPTELAAYTVVCATILNSDAAVMIR